MEIVANRRTYLFYKLFMLPFHNSDLYIYCLYKCKLNQCCKDKHEAWQRVDINWSNTGGFRQAFLNTNNKHHCSEYNCRGHDGTGRSRTIVDPERSKTQCHNEHHWHIYSNEIIGKSTLQMEIGCQLVVDLYKRKVIHFAWFSCDHKDR